MFPELKINISDQSFEKKESDGIGEMIIFTMKFCIARYVTLALSKPRVKISIFKSRRSLKSVDEVII